jgi:hypothetical protein
MEELQEIYGNMKPSCVFISYLITYLLKKGKVHPCTGTEALYRPYGPQGE